MNTMKYLIDKYPQGYKGWEEEYKVSQEGESIADVAEIHGQHPNNRPPSDYKPLVVT